MRRKADGKYLILRSSVWEERPDRSQQPDLPGGVVELNEPILQGAVREILEEAGIDIRADQLELVYAETFKSESDGASINRMIYFTEISKNTEVVLSSEHEEYWWATAEEILEMDMREPYPTIFTYLNGLGLLV